MGRPWQVYVVGIGQDVLGSCLVALPLLQRLRFTQHLILSLKVCLCVAANVAHSLQQNVLYVDSNGGMTASRLLQLLQARTQDEEKQVGGRVAGVLENPDARRPHDPVRCKGLHRLWEPSLSL